jgi:uncharacterized membrane protein required for colicin V production
MLDGAVGLILLVAVIRGAARGIGDTFLRLVGLAGGLGLSFMYSGKVSDYLEVSPVQRILHTHMYVIIRDYLMGGSDEPVQGADVTSTDIINGFVGNVRSDPYTEAMPKTISSAVNDLADKTANAAATRLTDICISILSVLAILLAVWLVMAIIRLIYRSARKSSALIRLSDRLLGMVLGVIRGLALSFLAAAALIPATTFFAPTRVPEMLAAMDQTYVAGILYDMNPVMLIVQHFFQ